MAMKGVAEGADAARKHTDMKSRARQVDGGKSFHRKNQYGEGRNSQQGNVQQARDYRLMQEFVLRPPECRAVTSSYDNTASIKKGTTANVS